MRGFPLIKLRKICLYLGLSHIRVKLDDCSSVCSALVLFTILFLLLTHCHSRHCPCLLCHLYQGFDDFLKLDLAQSLPQKTSEAWREGSRYLMVEVDFKLQLHCFS